MCHQEKQESLTVKNFCKSAFLEKFNLWMALKIHTICNSSLKGGTLLQLSEQNIAYYTIR